MTDVSGLFGWRDRLKPGVLINVAMQAQLERRFAGRAEDVGKAGAGMKYPLEALRGQVRKLRKVIEGLAAPRGDAWTTYTETHTYDAAAVKAKEAFVTRAFGQRRLGTVLDLGTNTGQYARLARTAAEHGSSPSTSARAASTRSIAARPTTRTCHRSSPIITKPTPAIGWRLIERKGLLDRLRGDFLLALALIHHLRITGGIPLSEVVDLLTRLAPSGVIEWVGREDPMVKRLLALVRTSTTTTRPAHSSSCWQRARASSPRSRCPSATGRSLPTRAPDLLRLAAGGP